MVRKTSTLRSGPPKSAYLYIKADEVNPLRVLPKSGERPADPPRPLTTVESDNPEVHHPRRPKREVTRPTRIQQPQTLPSETVAEEVPATGPSGLDTVTRLQKLEADFSAASGMPLTDQPIDALLAGYQGLASSSTVPEPTRKMADARAATLKARAEAREQFLAFQKQQTEQASKLQAQVAEGTEIEQRPSRRSMFACMPPSECSVPALCRLAMARPHLRTILYRLTDPATGRTIVYFRTRRPRSTPRCSGNSSASKAISRLTGSST